MARTEVEKKLIHIVMEMAYHEGLEEGRKQIAEAYDKKLAAESYDEGYEDGKRAAMEAMKQTAHSHTPQKNVYASLAFDRLPYFIEDTPTICGNCTHFNHEEYSDEGRCYYTGEPRIAGAICNIAREDYD